MFADAQNEAFLHRVSGHTEQNKTVAPKQSNTDMYSSCFIRIIYHNEKTSVYLLNLARYLRRTSSLSMIASSVPLNARTEYSHRDLVAFPQFPFCSKSMASRSA